MTLELVISTGDPQGVGPEVAVAAVRSASRSRPDAAFVLVGDRSVLARAGADPGWGPTLGRNPAIGVSILEVPLESPLGAPPPSAAGGRAALRVLDAALDRILADAATDRGAAGRRALVTAPVSKEAIRLGLPSFDGHTGYLARRLCVESPVMAFVTPSFRVALLTVHVPIARVPALVTESRLRKVVEVASADLELRFGISDPRIHVLGLNPHAGENGGIGMEEVEVLRPAIDRLRSEGRRVTGPYPADSYFRPGFERESDLIVAMYHDQGLLPVKCLAFGDAVNVTLGLPIVRTSVDHGTAFDRAWGRGTVESRSMERAIDLAAELLGRQPASRA